MQPKKPAEWVRHLSFQKLRNLQLSKSLPVPAQRWIHGLVDRARPVEGCLGWQFTRLIRPRRFNYL